MRIKFDENGRAYLPPSVAIRDGGTVYGYDRNAAMLDEDGWLAYDGDAPLSALAPDGNGGIREIEASNSESPAAPTRFTKLAIRRCLREAGMESALDAILAGNEQFRKDWEDALNIDLDDEMMVEAVRTGLVPAEMIALVRNRCEPFNMI